MSSPYDNTKLTPDWWVQRWSDGDIGWHHEAVNPHLLSYWNSLGAESGTKVFVPLCGKSKDMVWLAEQGHSVVGVEISTQAVEEFFAEQKLEPKVSSVDGFKIYRSTDYELFCGDIYNLNDVHLHGVSAVYDRAALVALNTQQRKSYAELLKRLLPDSCRMLLISMDYLQDEMKGPPHSVPESEIRDYFGGYFEISKLFSLNLLQETERYADRGLSHLHEVVFRLIRE